MRKLGIPVKDETSPDVAPGGDVKNRELFLFQGPKEYRTPQKTLRSFRKF
jgi:hypothetical protein